jgi:hypothetical protein
MEYVTNSNKMSRNYVFTLNNPTVAEVDRLRSLGEAILPDGADSQNSPSLRYMVWGKEVAPTTGTPHLQGYLEFRQTIRMRATKNYLGISRTHLAIRKGSQKQAVDYCKKDGDFCEYGVRARQGARTDLLRVQAQLDQGVHISEIAQEFFPTWVRNHRALGRYAQEYSRYARQKRKSRREPPRVLILWGPPGTGKSRRAQEIGDAEGGAFFVSPGSSGTVFYDGYEGEEHPVVIYDDFYGWERFSLLLRILDRYSLRVRT